MLRSFWCLLKIKTFDSDWDTSLRKQKQLKQKTFRLNDVSTTPDDLTAERKQFHSFIHSFIYFAINQKYNNSIQKYIKDNIQYSN